MNLTGSKFQPCIIFKASSFVIPSLPQDFKTSNNMKIEAEFQKMIAAAYGRAMLTKDQMIELRLAFIGGYMMGHNATLCAAAESTDEGEKVLELRQAICEAFTKANNDRK